MGRAFLPPRRGWCVWVGARTAAQAGRLTGRLRVGQIALASLHRSTCSRATSSVPGVLLLTSWGTMRASYRFPVRKPECHIRYWMVSDHYAGNVGRARPSGR